jgi:hypothetical protein
MDKTRAKNQKTVGGGATLLLNFQDLEEPPVPKTMFGLLQSCLFPIRTGYAALPGLQEAQM